MNRGLAAMTSGAVADGVSPAADPVKALRVALALRPGSERVKSKTRRSAAAHAMGLLTGDGWRAHHEKGLLRDLADVICALDVTRPASPSDDWAPRRTQSTLGVTRYYADFVDIQSDWDDLFAASSTLDLAIMYGATWRNTYRKDLRAMACRADGRIRIVLPEASPKSPLAAAYARTLAITSDDFRRKVSDAIDDFRSLGPARHVEIYVTTAIFRHAIYLFTHQAILALYALCGERIPTPALLACDGGMLSFIRHDFDRLLEQSSRIA